LDIGSGVDELDALTMGSAWCLDISSGVDS